MVIFLCIKQLIFVEITYQIFFFQIKNQYRILKQSMGNQKSFQTVYNGFQTTGGNLIWGSALGLAWNQIIQKYTQQPIEIQSYDKQALKMVDNFNKCQFTKKDIDANSIYVKSGYGQQTVEIINFECKKKFPQKLFDDINVKLGPTDIISYAYLLKKIQFGVKFTRQNSGSFLFQGKKCQSFYASDIKQKQQIKNHYYNNKDSFMISINDKKSSDQIFLIKDKKHQTIQTIIQEITKYQNVANQLKQIDKFQMPVVELDVKRNVTLLQGQALANSKLAGYQFSVVYEAIKLKVDQSGAKLENQGLIIALQSCSFRPKKEQPKHFFLDKTFWIVLKESGKHPYLCALIHNPTDI